MEKDLLTIKDLTGEEVMELFQLAKEIKNNIDAHRKDLAGKVLAMIFEKPSLRTRVTFETGIYQLGGIGIYLAPQDIQLGKREAVEDVARNLSRWVDGIMIRTFGQDILEKMAENATVPVINALSDLYHPCQILADLFTIWEKGHDLKNFTLAYVGDGNNIAHSLIWGAARTGMKLRIATPKGYEPNMEIVEAARREGAHIELYTDPREAVKGVDAIYTDVWASMGQEAEREKRLKVFPPYQVNMELFSLAKETAYFMHCLPAHRGEEVTDEVLDHPRSIVLDQAENRLHIQKAIMRRLMG